jgi:hypothetical protein
MDSRSSRATSPNLLMPTSCRLVWYQENDPSGLGFVSDDTFLYARCDAIVAGRERRAAAIPLSYETGQNSAAWPE